MKTNWPFFVMLGFGIILAVFLGIPQFLKTLFDAEEDFYLRLYMAFSTLFLAAFAYFMYRIFIHFAFEKQVLIFCNEYLDIGKKMLGSYKNILRIPRKDLPPLRVRNGFFTGFNENLSIHYNGKKVEIAANQPRKEKERIKCFYEKYAHNNDILNIYKLCWSQNNNEKIK